MTKLSYIQAGEAVSGDDLSGDGNANQVVRSMLTLSGLNPDSDFPGFLSQLIVQLNAAPLGGVNTINFAGTAIGSVTVLGGVATVTLNVQTLANILANSNDAGNHKIINVSDPTAAKDVVNLEYAQANFLPIVGGFPTTTTPIAQYYTADAGIGVSDGSPVPRWSDQSGNALDLLANDTGATSPTFHANIDGDGLPCVSFDGSANQLSSRGMTANNQPQMTFFCVSRSAHTTSNSTLFSICGSGGDNSGDGSITVTTKEPTGLQLRFNYNGTFGTFNAAAPTSNSASSTDDGIAEWTIAVYRLRTIFNGGYVTIRQNFSGANFALGVALTNNTYTNVYLGSGSTSGVGWPTNSKCDVRAFGIYKGLLQDYEVKKLMRYLGNKWNITGFI